MSITPVLPSRSSGMHRILSYCLSTILVGMLVLQLYTYDEFSEAFTVLLPASASPQLVMLTPALIVIIELIALSYALPLYLSRLARIVARVATCGVPTIWAIILLLPLARSQAGVYPLFSTKIPLSIDIVSLLPLLLLTALIATVVYMDVRRTS